MGVGRRDWGYPQVALAFPQPLTLVSWLLLPGRALLRLNPESSPRHRKPFCFFLFLVLFEDLNCGVPRGTATSLILLTGVFLPPLAGKEHPKNQSQSSSNSACHQHQDVLGSPFFWLFTLHPFFTLPVTLVLGPPPRADSLTIWR